MNWDAILDETAAHLRRMIQIDTTNPPGNELPLAQYVATVLEAAGIATRLIEPTRNRAAVIGRIPGTGRARPLLLLAHMDVVGVERAEWSVDPFAGEIRDGFLYGRGAIDDKGMLAANLMVMLLAARAIAAGGPRPDRDLVFLATSDEEAGGEWGLGWVAANHPEVLDAEFALNEGGRTRVVDGRTLYVAVQVAEKVSNVVRVTARGPAGHAAIPLRDNAVAALARAVARIAAHEEPLHLLPATREFFRELAPVWPHPEEAALMRDVAGDDPDHRAAAAAQLSAIPVFNAVLRNGISPTVITGGMRHNVIPTEASALLSIRTLPGVALEDVLARLGAVVDDPAVELAVESCGVDAPASDHASPMFAAIRDAVQAIDRTIVTVPYLSTGATDSAILRSVGIQAFGVLPFPLEQADESRMHAADERVPLVSLQFGVRLLHGAVARMTLSSGGMRDA